MLVLGYEETCGWKLGLRSIGRTLNVEVHDAWRHKLDLSYFARNKCSVDCGKI